MKTIAFVCPWYGDNIPGGAEAALRGITSHLHDAGLPVEILTTTVEQFTADWNKDFYPEGVTKNAFGVDVRRFKIRKRDVKAFDSVNYKLMNGIRLTDKDEEVFNREMINSPAMYDYIRDNKDNYQCFVYIPYLFGTTYNELQHVLRSRYLYHASMMRGMHICTALPGCIPGQPECCSTHSRSLYLPSHLWISAM